MRTREIPVGGVWVIVLLIPAIPTTQVPARGASREPHNVPLGAEDTAAEKGHSAFEQEFHDGELLPC